MNFVQDIAWADLETISKRFQNNSSRKKSYNTLTLKNEVRPIDLFCYLFSRFGPPNGMQSLLRGDSSDNLIHWEWTFTLGDGFVDIQGHNFRTEICFTDLPASLNLDSISVAEQFKSDFKKYGPRMSTLRKKLEHWEEFLNPYYRVKHSLDSLINELRSLGLVLSKDSIPDLPDFKDRNTFQSEWKATSQKYSKGMGLAFGIRAMLPVRVESFVNMLIFLLAIPEIRKTEKDFKAVFRLSIYERIKSLPNNCLGFNKSINRKCLGDLQALMARRNDILHGNVALHDLQFGEVFFAKRLPIFLEYSTMWERSFGVGIRGSGYENVEIELRVVEDVEEYLLSRLDPEIRSQVEVALGHREFGIEKKSKRFGLLFSERLADFVLIPDRRNETTTLSASTS